MTASRIRLSGPQAAVLRSVKEKHQIPLRAREVTIQALRDKKLIKYVTKHRIIAHITELGEKILARYDAIVS